MSTPWGAYSRTGQLFWASILVILTIFDTVQPDPHLFSWMKRYNHGKVSCLGAHIQRMDRESNPNRNVRNPTSNHDTTTSLCIISNHHLMNQILLTTSLFDNLTISPGEVETRVRSEWWTPGMSWSFWGPRSGRGRDRDHRRGELLISTRASPYRKMGDGKRKRCSPCPR